MQHHGQAPGRQRGARQKVRRAIDAELGWLRGVPIGRSADGTLRWLTLPRAGVRGAASELVVDAERIRRTTYRRNQIVRDFPRALPAVVGDRDAWLAGVDATLRDAKRLLGGAPAPDLDAALQSRSVPVREASRVLELRRRHPALDPLVGAYVLAAAEPADRGRAMAAIRAHAADLTAVIARHGAEAAMQVVELAAIVGGSALAELLDDGGAMLFAEDLDPSTSAPVDDRAGLRQAIDGFASGECERIRWPLASSRHGSTEPSAAGDLASALLEADPAQTRALVKLAAGVLPDAMQLAARRQFHGEWDAARKACERRLRHFAGPQRGATWRRLRQIAATELERVLRAQPLHWPVAEIHARLVRLARARDRTAHELIGELRQALGRVPRIVGGHAARARLFLRWSAAVDAWPAATAIELIRSLGRYFGAARDPARALLPWHWGREGHWSSPEWVMLHWQRGSPRRLLDALDRLTQRADLDLAAAPPNHLTVLANLLGAVPSADVGAELHAAMLQHSEARKLCALDHDAIVAAGRMAGGDATRYLAVALAIRRRSALARGVETLCSATATPANARLLGDAILVGEHDAAIRIASGLRLLAGAPPAPRQRRTKPSADAWWQRYPAGLHAALASLDALADDAEQQAARLLGRAFPDHDRLTREIDALRSRIGGAPAQRAASMRERLANLEHRRATGGRAPPAKLARLADRLEERLLRARLARFEQQVAGAVRDAIAARAGAHAAKHAADPALTELLPHLLELPAATRELAFRLLERRAGPPPWDLRDDPRNAAFLARLEARGIDVGPWLDSAPDEVRAPGTGRTATLEVATDPVDVFLMGAPFGTCLSPGDFNFFSTVANAADINKRVLFARDERRQVLGRCLLALTDEGAILTFHAYSHDRRLAFAELVSDRVRRLAAAMNTHAAAHGKVSCLVARRWYDDGPQDVTGAFACLQPGSPLRRSLPSIDPNGLVDALRLALGPHPIDGVVLEHLVRLPELTERPELLAQLTAELVARGSATCRVVAATTLHRSGHALLAARLVDDLVRSRRARRVLDSHTGKDLAALLVAEAPGEALSVLRDTRCRWTVARQLIDDGDPARLIVAADANRALHRRTRALALYRQAASFALRNPQRTHCARAIRELEA